MIDLRSVITRAALIGALFVGMVGVASAAPPAFDAPQGYDTVESGWGTNPNALASADVNGDGCPDVVVANGTAGGSGNSVSVLRGGKVGASCTGALGSPVHVQVAASPMDVRLADLNADGCPDIVVSTSSNLYRFLNQTSGAACTGTFGSSAAQSLTAGRALELRDLDGDGCTDAVVGNWLNWSWPSFVSVLRGQKLSGACTGVFLARTDVNTSATFNAGRGSQNLTIGDMNADSCPDIVAAARRGFDSFSVMLQNKTGATCQGTFGTGIVYQGTVACGAEGVAIGDFNEDGFADIVGLMTEGSPCPIEIMLGANGVNGAIGTLRDGANATTYATVDNSNPGRVRTADFNQDGHLDVAVAPCCVMGISVFPGVGNGTLASRIDFDPAVAAAQQSPGLLITDLDADGVPDILTTVSGGGVNKVVVFINSYTPPAQERGGDSAPSAGTGSSPAVSASSPREEAAAGVIRPASRLNQVSVLRERRRGAPIVRLRDAFTLARPGRYTLLYVRPDGMRATVRTDTVIGSRTIRKPMSAPVIHVTDVSRPLQVSAFLSPKAVREGLTLRLILRDPDGSLSGSDFPGAG